jgi:glycosyltransferase involved in cell wall biosynthesis
VNGETIDVRGNEGFPRTHLEAMSFGLPIVGTDIAGVREQVEHGTNGLVVPPSDPAALADALEQLITAPDLRKRMGRAGRQRVEERFSTQACVRGAMNVYSSLLPA